MNTLKSMRKNKSSKMRLSKKSPKKGGKSKKNDKPSTLRLFKLKLPLIKLKLGKGDKIINQVNPYGRFHAKSPYDAAKKAFSGIARSRQLEGKSDKNIYFCLIEFSKHTIIKEFYYKGSNAIASPPLEVKMKRTNGKSAGIIRRWVKPMIEKVMKAEFNKSS